MFTLRVAGAEPATSFKLMAGDVSAMRDVDVLRARLILPKLLAWVE
jgi:hypothetical protein